MLALDHLRGRSDTSASSATSTTSRGPRMTRRVVPAGRSAHECETVGAAFPFEPRHPIGGDVEQRHALRRGQRALGDEGPPVPEHHDQQRGRDGDQAERAAHRHAVRLRRSATTTAAAREQHRAAGTQAAQKIARASRAVSTSVEKGPGVRRLPPRRRQRLVAARRDLRGHQQQVAVAEHAEVEVAW